MNLVNKETKKFNVNTCLLIVFAIMLNMVGRYTCAAFDLPLWLDSLGTFLVAIAVGPIIGGLVGVVSILSNMLFMAESIEYSIVAFAAGIIVGLFYPKDTHDMFQSFCTAAITTLTTVILSTPISIVLYDGYVGNKWGDACYEMLIHNNNSKVTSSFLGQAFIDLPDKVISILIVQLIIKIYTKSKSKKEAA